MQKDAVTVVDEGGKTRWKMTGLTEPSDVHFLPGRRVLLGEVNRVTERTLDGKITWQVPIARAKEFRGNWGDVGGRPATIAALRKSTVVNKQIIVQRLKDGHTFIGCADRLIEVDGAGKVVMDLAWNKTNWPQRTASRKLPDGTIVAFVAGTIRHFDGKGKEKKRVKVVFGGYGYSEFLDNGHLLALSPANGNLIEFDLKGRRLRWYNYPGANSAFRLPNGHTLITHIGSYENNEGGKECVEIDKNWKRVKTIKLPARAIKVKQFTEAESYFPSFTGSVKSNPPSNAGSVVIPGE
jgi:hypothetical protein